MTDIKRTTVRLDPDTEKYIEWKIRGAGYVKGNTMHKIINDGIRVEMIADVNYSAINHSLPKFKKAGDSFRFKDSPKLTSACTMGYGDINEK